jgi:hypothetical protein
MKPFQILLFLTVIILIGGIAALYWGQSIEEATVPIEIVEEPMVEPAQDELSPGSYLVFQSVEVTDSGSQDWANDDTETYTFYRLVLGEATYRSNHSPDDLVAFATIEHPATISGGLTTYVYGQHLLMHRYLDDDQDGLLSLVGEIAQTSSKNWSRFRSSNGMYEVRYEFGLESPSVDFGTFEVTNVATGEMVAQHTLTLDSGEIGNPEPFLIDNEGAYLYVHQVCGCEATLSGLWQVEVATGEATRLDTLANVDSWFLSNLDANNRRLLAIETDSEPSTDGPGENLLPPTTIRILDLERLEATDLLVDEDRAWDRPWLDPEGNDRYVLRLWDEGNSLYLVNADDTEISEDQLLTNGWVLDWVRDWLVVSNSDLSLKLVNLETKEEIKLEFPLDRVKYIGSIELN